MHVLHYLFCHLHPKERTHVLDLVEYGRDRGSSVQQTHRHVVERRDQRTGVAAGRDVGGDDLIHEPADPSATVVDVNGSVDRRDPTRRVVGGATSLLYYRADRYVPFAAPAPYVAGPVDFPIEVV